VRAVVEPALPSIVGLASSIAVAPRFGSASPFLFLYLIRLFAGFSTSFFEEWWPRASRLFTYSFPFMSPVLFGFLALRLFLDATQALVPLSCATTDYFLPAPVPSSRALSFQAIVCPPLSRSPGSGYGGRFPHLRSIVIWICRRVSSRPCLSWFLKYLDEFPFCHPITRVILDIEALLVRLDS